jgi:hypothetical protein
VKLDVPWLRECNDDKSVGCDTYIKKERENVVELSIPTMYLLIVSGVRQ